MYIIVGNDYSVIMLVYFYSIVIYGVKFVLKNYYKIRVVIFCLCKILFLDYEKYLKFLFIINIY